MRRGEGGGGEVGGGSEVGGEMGRWEVRGKEERRRWVEEVRGEVMGNEGGAWL